MGEESGHGEKVPLRRRRFRGFCRLELVRSLEQAAKIFFAGDDFRAVLAGEAGHGFVFHFKSFQTHDADVFPALFPNLALAQFHGVMIPTDWEKRLKFQCIFKRRPFCFFDSEVSLTSRTK
jgi:hypothetical protein